MLEIKAPNPLDDAFLKQTEGEKVCIFLGGSIEMGKAEPWQEKACRLFKDNDNVILVNPRRIVWDSSLKQSLDSPKFVEQVEWELSALEQCEIVLMYFDPKTQSPISLLETGLTAFDESTIAKRKLHVVCPKGFYRKGNIDVVCRRYQIPQFDTLESAIDTIKSYL